MIFIRSVSHFFCILNNDNIKMNFYFFNSKAEMFDAECLLHKPDLIIKHVELTKIKLRLESFSLMVNKILLIKNETNQFVTDSKSKGFLRTIIQINSLSI